MTNQKILLVEDEKDLQKLIRYNLEKEGYVVKTASDGEAGLALFRKDPPDLIILDVMLPKLDGFEFCRIVRQESKIPIVMLTAKREEVDRVLGLELGADDYVTKPFSVRELTARLKAILRRTAAPVKSESEAVRAGKLEIDLERYEVKVGGKPVSFSTKEFEFLKCLIEADGRALSRDQIMERVWGYDKGMEIDSRTIDQHVARIREKLGAEEGRIITVKNVGYRFKRD